MIEALGLIEPDVSAPAAVQAARTALQATLTAWDEMHAVSHQSVGSGPGVGMFEDKLAQRVSIRLPVYRNALSAAELAPDPLQRRRPVGSGFDFYTSEVAF